MANKIVSFDFDGCLHRSVINGHPIGRDNYHKWIPYEKILILNLFKLILNEF
jgi:hypothetical protein